MAKGGPRAGAGRPKGAGRSVDDEVRIQSRLLGITPLDYMLSVINDPSADPLRRDRMAQAAAPYVHPKAGEATGKKEQRYEQAKVAQQGTEWESLLDGPSVN